MKEKMRLVSGSCWAIGGLWLGIVTAVSAADRYWDGDSSSFWATAANWSNNIAPVAGDNLFFPSGFLIPSAATNNFPAGTAFGRISISEIAMQGYTLGGNRVVLNDGIVFTGNQFSYAPYVACDLTLGADQLFSSTRGITIAGQLDVNGHTLTVSSAASGNFFFSGSVVSSVMYGQITKTNTGLMAISPTSHVISVPLYVGRGTLRVDGAVTNGSGGGYVSVVASGGDIFNPLPYGSAVLAGSGAVDHAEVNDTVSPGNNGPGVLRCQYIDLTGYTCGFLCGVRPGTFLAELNGTVAGTGYDQLEVYAYDLWKPQDGSTVYSPALLDARVGYAAQEGDTYQIINLLPGNPFGFPYSGGYFSGLLPGYMLDLTNGYTLGITYSNGVALQTLRTPSSDFQLWKGYSNSDRFWSSSNNWAGGVSPAPGGRLRFTPYQYREAVAIVPPVFYFADPPPLTNDIVGLSLAALSFSETNYVLSGNGVTVTEGITNRVSSGTNLCNLDVAVIGSLALDVDAGGQLILVGAFGGGGTVRKDGGGQLLYAGTTQNSFVGTFEVNNGTLCVNGSLTDADFAVNGGLLAGTGYVGSVTLSGGTINAGGSPGVLHVQGNFALSAGATCQLDLNGPVAGSGYDQLQVNGTVSLNGATLDVRPGYAIPVGSVFLVIANDASDAVAGTFAGLPQGATFQAGGQYFSISYQSGSGGNDVVLTRVNSPPPPARFSDVAQVDAATVQLQGTGGSNVSYTVQASTNLSTTNWLDIGTAAANAAGIFSFTETNVLATPQRYYRLRWP